MLYYTVTTPRLKLKLDNIRQKLNSLNVSHYRQLCFIYEKIYFVFLDPHFLLRSSADSDKLDVVITVSKSSATQYCHL